MRSISAVNYLIDLISLNLNLTHQLSPQNQYKQREAEFTRELEQERQRYTECQKELKTLLLEKVDSCKGAVIM